MDPIGFGMENFNTAGLYRTTDNGQPIDATGTLDGASFNGLAELGTVLRKDVNSAPCVVTKNYTNAQGRAPTDWDTAALNALTAQFTASGNRADKLLVNLVSSDAFRFVHAGVFTRRWKPADSCVQQTVIFSAAISGRPDTALCGGPSNYKCGHHACEFVGDSARTID